MMAEAVSEAGSSVGGGPSNSVSSSGFSQDLFSPLQFCEVVQGGQQQQHQLVSGPNNIVQATAIASPVTTLVSATGQQLQQQHQLLPQQQQQQQQLVLHSPHKALQPPLAPPALLAPASLPLPHPPSPHHLPPSATPLAPLHHQHQHHLHQIQLQQLHHHQQLQQQHHHQQQLQPHQLHHHHHHHHLHPQHLYTTHQQHLQQQQQHQHQIHLQQQHQQQQQLQQQQLQQQQQQQHQHQQQQQQQQQQQAQLQQKQKQQSQKQHKQKHSHSNKSAVKEHNPAKSSRKAAHQKQQQSLTGSNKRSKTHHQSQQQVEQKEPQGLNQTQLNQSEHDLQQKQTLAKQQHKTSQQQLQDHSQHSVQKQEQQHHLQQQQLQSQQLQQKPQQQQMLLQKQCQSQQYPTHSYQQEQLNQTTQQLMHIQHPQPEPTCVLYNAQHEQGKQNQQWVLNIATSNDPSCQPAKTELLQASINRNHQQGEDSSLLIGSNNITNGDDGDINNSTSSPSTICDDKNDVSVSSTSLSSTADILSATLNAKNEDDMDLKPEISENVDVFSPVPDKIDTPNTLGIGYYSVAQTVPQVTVSTEATHSSCQSGTRLGDGLVHPIKCESAPLGPISQATLLPLTNAIPCSVDAPPTTIPTMSLTSSASVFISPGQLMPIASPVHMLNSPAMLCATSQSAQCSTVSLSSPSALSHPPTNTFSSTPQSVSSSMSSQPLLTPCLSTQCMSTVQHLSLKPCHSQSLVFQPSTPQPLFSQASILQTIPHASALQPLSASFTLQPLTSQSLALQAIGSQPSSIQTMPLQSSLTLQTLNTAPSFIVQRSIPQPLILQSPSNTSPTSRTIVLSSPSQSVAGLSSPPVSSPSSRFQPVTSPHQFTSQPSEAVSSFNQVSTSSPPATSCAVQHQSMSSSKSSPVGSTSTVTFLSPVYTSTSLTTSSSPTISINASSASSYGTLPRPNFTTLSSSSPPAATSDTKVSVSPSPAPSIILKPSRDQVTSPPIRLPTCSPVTSSYSASPDLAAPPSVQISSPSLLPVKVSTRSVCIGTDPEPPPSTLPSFTGEESIVLVTGVSVSTNTSPPGSPGPSLMAYNQGKIFLPSYHPKENTFVLSDTYSNDKMILISTNDGVDKTLPVTSSSYGHKIIPCSPGKSRPAASSIETKMVMPSLASLPPSQSVSLAESAQLVSAQPQSQAGSWALTTLVDVVKAQPSTQNSITKQVSSDISNGASQHKGSVSQINQYWQQQQLVPMASILPNEKISIEVQLSPTVSSSHKRVMTKEIESSITVKRESSDKDDEVTVIAITPATAASCLPTPTTPATPVPLVKRTWRRPWKKKKEREKKQQQKAPRKARRSRPRKRVVYHRAQTAHVDQRNGPPIDTMKTVVSRQSEENIDALKQKRQRIKLNRNSGREYINRLGKPVRHAITSKSTTDGRASQRKLQSNQDSDAESTYLPSD